VFRNPCPENQPDTISFSCMRTPADRSGVSYHRNTSFSRRSETLRPVGGSSRQGVLICIAPLDPASRAGIAEAPRSPEHPAGRMGDREEQGPQTMTVCRNGAVGYRGDGEMGQENRDKGFAETRSPVIAGSFAAGAAAAGPSFLRARSAMTAGIFCSIFTGPGTGSLRPAPAQQRRLTFLILERYVYPGAKD
jgi:hypothetical protein